METGTSTDDASIPVSLVQYLWSRWKESPPDVRDAVTAVIGELMRSPRWHWDVTVLPDQSLPDPQGPFVSEHAGRPTIGISIAMLRDLWRWVLRDIDERAAVLRWWAPTLDPALWQELRTYQPAHGRRLTEQDWYLPYGYLSPALLPDIVRATDHLLSSADPDDQQMALTTLEQWLASDDHATRTLATQMLRAWLNEQATASSTHYRRRLRAITMLSSSDDPAVVSEHLYDLLRTARNRITLDDVHTVIGLLHRLGDGRPFATDRWRSLLGEMVRGHPSDVVIREVLDRMMPAILSSVRTDDRARWAATLWDLVTDPTLPERRYQMIAGVLEKMIQRYPTVAALVRGRLQVHLSPQRIISEPVWDPLLKGFMQTPSVGEMLEMIDQAIHQAPNTIARFDSILAAGWGHGRDQRILQIIDSVPGPHWHTVLTEGVTASVGAAVCARIQAWLPHDQAMATIVDHIYAREDRENWPLAPLPAYLIPWVGKAARARPYRLHPTTIRRLWLVDPNQAWDVTQTMLHSDDPSVQQRAIAAMDTGWGTWHAAEVATTLRARILEHQDDRDDVKIGIATAVAGIGIAPPSIMESLLTELARKGNEEIQDRIIRTLHRGWGRGQDALVLRVVAIITERDSAESIWDGFHETLAPAWDHLPSHMVMPLVDRLVTHETNRLAKAGPFSLLIPWEVQRIPAAFASVWTRLPTAQVIERIAHHVAHLHKHAHTMPPTTRDRLVSVWASVVTAGAARLSASDFHAVLDPLWDLSPYGCLNGVLQGVVIDEARRRGRGS
jgi:hypothetical protein